MLTDFFINLTILFTFLFISMQLFKKYLISTDMNIQHKLLFGAANGVLGIVLMFNAIQVTEITIVDLRHIPAIIAGIYGGWISATISVIFITIGRFWLGVNASSFAAVILMSCILIGILFLLRLKKNNYIKTIFMAAFSSLVFTIIIPFLVKDIKVLSILIPAYWIISIIGGLVAIYITEYLQNTNKLFKTYQEQSTIDFLTGLGNVRYFDDCYNKLSERSKEREEELGLLFLDIDFFKKINDTYGHNDGDLVLQQIGEILKYTTREYDIVCRNGGEEFSVMLPDTSIEKVKQVAERIRKTIEASTFSLSGGKNINITVSIGISHYSNSNNLEKLLDEADIALYEAKNTGRNRICIA
ncbi:diguanylate cyclase [Bacillus timonensis]|nr:diguanylate cyclase [Bacillus timonensis]